MDTEQKILLEVEVKATEALKELGELRQKAADLKKAQKELDTSTAEGRAQYEQLGVQIKNLNSQSREREKVIQNEIKLQQSESGSINQLKAKLSLMTAEYYKMSAAQRDTKAGKALQANIAETADKINVAEQSLLNFRNQVGNYEVATKSLRQELRELTEQLMTMKIAGDDSSETYQTMAQRLAMLKDAQEDVANEIKNMASDTRSINMMNETFSTMAGLAGGLATTFIAMGADGEEATKVIMKLQVVTNALAVATQLQNAAQKESNVYALATIALQKIGINQTVRAAAAEAAYAKMKTAGSVSAKIAAAAQWLWNAALAANPVVLITIALVALVAGIYMLTKAFSGATEEEKAAAKAGEAYEKQVRKTAREIEQLDRIISNSTNKRKNQWKEEELALRASGATAEAIAKAKAKADKELRDIEIKLLNIKIKAQYAEYTASMRNIQAQKALLATMAKGSKDYSEQSKKVIELAKAHNELVKVYDENQQKQTELNLQSREETVVALEKEREAYKQAAIKAFEQRKAVADERASQEKLSLENDFFLQQEYADKEFKRLQQFEKEKLFLQKRFGEISAKDYEDSLIILQEKKVTYDKQRAINLQNSYEEELKNIKSIIKKNDEEVISETNKKYSNEITSLRKHNDLLEQEYMSLDIKRADGGLSESEKKRFEELKKNILENGTYEQRLQEAWIQELQQKRKESLSERIKDIDTSLTDEFALELAKFSDNEKAKLKIQKEMAIKRLEELRSLSESETDEGSKSKIQEEIYKAEAALRKANSDENLAAMNREEANTYKSENEKHKIKVAFLNEQLALSKDNAEKIAEINQALTDELSRHQQETIKITRDYVDQYGGMVMDSLNAINDIMKAAENVQMQQYEEDNEKKKQSLESRLKSGLISQEQYDKGVAKADAELDKKKKDLAIKQAKRDKALGIMNATLNTALAILKIWAEVPKGDFAISTIALTAVAAAIGASQIATIAAQPLPTAARGGMIGGKKHSQGGTFIEAEQGEAIINAKSMGNPRLRELASLINEAGGGVPFVKGRITPTSDGGYYRRNSSEAIGRQSFREMGEIISDSINKRKTYVTVEDIRRADINYTEVESINKNR